MADLDPNTPGVLTHYVICRECDAKTPVMVDIGEPPKAGTYELSGICTGCGKPLGGITQVQINDPPDE